MTTLNDEDKTREQLIQELSELRKRLEDATRISPSDQRAASANQRPQTEALREPRFNRTKGEKLVSDLAQFKHERDLLRIVLNSIADEVWLCDADGNLSLVNTAAVRGLGFESPDELYVPMPQWLDRLEIYTPDGTPRAQEDAPLLRSLTKGETLREIEEIVRHPKKGGLLHRQVSSAPLKADDGRIVGAVAVVRDITGRRQAEAELHNSEQRYRELFEHMSEGFFLAEIICDASGTPVDYRHLAVNPAMETVVGLTPDDLVGKTRREVFETVSPWFDMFGRVAQSGTPERSEGYSAALNRHFSILAYSPKPGRFAGLVQDITERRKSHEDQARQQELLQKIVDNIPILLVMWDPNLKRFTLNRHAEHVLGWTNADANQGDFMTKVYPDVEYREAVSTFMQDLEPGWREWMVTTKTNKRVPVEWANIRLADDTMIGIGVDLRRRKKDEEALSESIRELNEFAYALTHNLKAPFRAVQNYAEFLTEDLADILEGESKQYLEGITKAILQANQQFQDLESLYQIKSYELEAETFDLNGLLHEMQANFSNDADRRLIVAPRLPVLNCCKHLLRQILLDLIENGFKYNLSGVKTVEVGWQPASGDRFEIFVRDNGIGIDLKYHQQIFGIFRRLHTDREYDGTGMGLAIAAKAAHKMDAVLRVESTVGKGSTFYVSMPNSLLGNSRAAGGASAL